MKCVGVWVSLSALGHEWLFSLTTSIQAEMSTKFLGQNLDSPFYQKHKRRRSFEKSGFQCQEPSRQVLSSLQHHPFRVIIKWKKHRPGGSIKHIKPPELGGAGGC